MKTTLLLTLVSLCALAADPKPVGKQEKAKPKFKAPSLGLTFGGVPNSDGIVKPKAEKPGDLLKATPAAASYKVVSAQHAKSFLRTPNGAQPVGGPLQAVALVGSPPSTEPFTTVLRVKSPQKQSAPIDVVILDPRGDTVMTSRGELTFRGAKEDEVDYTVDWAATPWPRGGEFQVLVRIGGQALGTFPLKVAGQP